MKSSKKPTYLHIVLAILTCCILAACGGGDGNPPSVGTAPADTGTGNANDGGDSSPSDSTSTITATAVTKVEVVNTDPIAETQSDVPITFGQVFRPGDVSSSDGVSLTDQNGAVVPFQLDVKARNPDGSIRHGIFSIRLPQLDTGKSDVITISKTSTGSSPAPGASPGALLDAGFTASVNITIGGTLYTASADALLASGNYKTWLSGPLVNEWLVSAPLKKIADGTEHPHLTAHFAIRSYTGTNKARVDVTVENDWAYEPSPQNFTYDVDIRVGGKSVYSKTGLTHFSHARWRKIFWWGTAPQVDVKQDIDYLIATKAVPNYDTSITISDAGLNDLLQRWNAKDTGPMGPGIVNPAMPNVGGRPDIGPLPQWAAMYLLSMDPRAEKVTLGVGDLAGSWPIHYRDKNTGLPVSLDDHPYMTLLGHPGDAINPVTKQSDYFPACGGDCSTGPYNYQPDINHQPSLDYLPYLVTGDYYYLEELQFWANWNMLEANPAYRELEKGLVKWAEVRGQAWALRTLGQVAYITPDSDSMKKYFTDRLAYNLDFYNATYTTGNPNQLGVVDGSGIHGFAAILYPTAQGAQTGVAPWQDDFFTWSTGYLSDLGFTNAKSLLAWKAKFPVGRMRATGYCWIDGATYKLAVRPSATSPLFTTFAQAYNATKQNADGTPLTNSTGAKYLDQPCGSQQQADWRTQNDIDMSVTRGPWAAGEMDGHAESTEGYPSNMQPALAVAATSGIPDAQAAWNTFIKRSIKPDYSSEPQWAIVPRE